MVMKDFFTIDYALEPDGAWVKHPITGADSYEEVLAFGNDLVKSGAWGAFRIAKYRVTDDFDTDLLL
jgi:hypothetical protein